MSHSSLPPDERDFPGADAVRAAYVHATNTAGNEMASDADLPSAAVDDAIRAAARRAVHAGPASDSRRRAPHWFMRHRVPLSAAAVIALSASLVLVMQVELSTPTQKVANVTDTAKPEREAGVTAPSQAARPAIPAETVSVVASPASPAREQAPRPPGAAVTANTPVALTRADVKPSAAAPPRAETRALVPQPPAYVPPSETPVVVAAVPPPPAAQPAPAAQGKAKEEKSIATNEVAAKTTAPLADLRRDAAREETARAAAAPAQFAAAAPLPPRAASVPAATLAKAAVEPADAWIKRLLELQKAGETTRLAEELRRFKQAYPQVELPKVLADVKLDDAPTDRPKTQ